MKFNQLLLAAGVAATLLTVGNAQSATEVLDQVVAIVDDDIVMASELHPRKTS